MIGAFGSNAISAGVGAPIGGWLCDQFGRKRIYQWDLLVYAFGLLWIIFAQEAWMLVVGLVIAGLAVGADVPASWTLITESAPNKARGRHAGFAQLLWMRGPVVVLLMSFALADLGVLGTRIVFAHLLVVALVLWGCGAGCASRGSPLSLAVAIGYVVLLGVGGGFAQQPLFQLWSGELFPTLLRSTAQGMMFAVVRIGLGIRSFFVPPITAAGFHTLAWILTGFVSASALLGLLFAPSSAGKSLDEIQRERGGDVDGAGGGRRFVRDRERSPSPALERRNPPFGGLP